MTISPFFKTVSFLLVFLQFVSIGLLILLEPIFSSGMLLLVQAFAILVGLAGVFALQLGRFNIVPIPKDGADLQTSGIYAYIRHPMYASIFLFFSPALLTMSEPISFIVFAILAITLLVKLHFEEFLLKQKFADYENYQKHSKKLIPFIF